ncbi:N-acetylglucosaminyl-diphospho-decaprenol L-rhamnosyltransferase [Lacticaseibacillus paracasei]|uniref:glycosyltransferase family 2 protein n=1 Tax=Lacticaseibacillus paracasei TaxID=1597 RepID=UPI000F0B03C5|nr:glycosyltransferase family 2 protein [Lacticaseibacillus paracasei]RNE43143.1 N-acetylglucosaminyl-diphospho-decaprenol L-rhamnosyltransferase [Lacticaseibacillus paracasei]
MNKVTVVIPAYSNPNLLDKCFNSVVASRNKVDFDILIVNDNPSNSEVCSWAENVSHHQGTRLITNLKNLGFSGAVNTGISASKGDVIILNSDTEVGESFVDKLAHIAELDPSIGTISTLTNNGTILSVPNYLQDTPISTHINIRKVEQKIHTALIQTKWFKKNQTIVARIPTPVGHALYITRRAISRVGLFDQATFQQGYGEENDFGERVRHAEFQNVTALNCFVLHRGASSFGDSRRALVKAHSKIIYRRYPMYRIKVALFTHSNNVIKQLCSQISSIGNLGDFY